MRSNTVKVTVIRKKTCYTIDDLKNLVGADRVNKVAANRDYWIKKGYELISETGGIMEAKAVDRETAVNYMVASLLYVWEREKCINPTQWKWMVKVWKDP